MEEVCEICKTAFHSNDQVFICPFCNQDYHPEHMKMWLIHHMSCPVCLRTLDLSSLESEKNRLIYNPSLPFPEKRIVRLDIDEIMFELDNGAATRFYSKDYEPIEIRFNDNYLRISQYDIPFLLKYIISFKWYYAFATLIQLILVGLVYNFFENIFWNLGISILIFIMVVVHFRQFSVFRVFFNTLYSKRTTYILIGSKFRTNFHNPRIVIINSNEIISIRNLKFKHNRQSYPGIDLIGDRTVMLADPYTEFSKADTKIILEILNTYLNTSITNYDYELNRNRLLIEKEGVKDVADYPHTSKDEILPLMYLTYSFIIRSGCRNTYIKR